MEKSVAMDQHKRSDGPRKWKLWLLPWYHSKPPNVALQAQTWSQTHGRHHDLKPRSAKKKDIDKPVAPWSLQFLPSSSIFMLGWLMRRSPGHAVRRTINTSPGPCGHMRTVRLACHSGTKVFWGVGQRREWGAKKLSLR